MPHRDLPELPSDEELGIDDSEEEGSADERAAGWLAALAAVLVLLVGAWGSSSERTLPAPVPANAPDTAFSSSRAMTQLVDLARSPRPLGAPEHTRVRELIMDRLRGLDLEPQVQTSLSTFRSGQSVHAATLRNVLARIPGASSTGAVLLMAHYDGVPHSPAAADDGVGVVAILEVLRALQAGPPLANDLIVLLTDGEEAGLLGARAFVEAHPWMDDVALALNVEMRGGGGPSIMFETGPENGWVVQAMASADPRPMAHSLSVEVYRRMPNYTDFTVFREAGVQGLNFAGIGDAWVYHQATDTPANVQEATLQHHGMRVLALVRELGHRDLGQVDAPDRAHFVVPGVGLVDLSLDWISPAAAGVGLLWLLVVVVGLVRGMGFPALGVGLLAATVCGLGAAAMGWAAMQWLPRFHPEFGYLTPAFYGEGWYMLALAAAALALVTAVFGWLRRWFSLPGLAAGALLVPVLGGVALAVTVPMAAVVLLGPAAAGLLAVGVSAVTGRPQAGEVAGAWVWVIGVLLALPVLALLVPVIELLWVAMSFRLAAALGVLVVVTLLCLLPLLDTMGTPNRWWAPVASAGAALAFLVGGIWLGGPSHERPLPSTLIYGLERSVMALEVEAAPSPPVLDTLEVLPEPGPPIPHPLPTLAEILDQMESADVRDDPMEDDARAHWIGRDDPGQEWVESQVAPLLDGAPPAIYGLTDDYRSAAAPAVPAPRPAVRVLGVEGPDGDGRRTVRLAIVSRVGAELLRVDVSEEEGVEPRSLGGEALPTAQAGAPGARRPVTRILHQGTPEGPLTLELQVEAGVEGFSLQVTEEHLRPWELVGDAAYQRPSHLMPMGGYRPAGVVWGEARGGLGDRAILVTPVSIALP